MSRAQALAAVGWVLLGGACATPSALPPPVPLPTRDPHVASLLERARDDSGARERMRAVATVKLHAERRSGRFREVIIAARPAQLRLETLNLLGQTQTLLVTDGERFAFWDGKRMERGPVNPEVLRHHLGLDLEPAEAVRALLAAPTIPERTPEQVFAQAGGYIVLLRPDLLRFGPAGELRGVEALDERGGTRWSVAYDGWRDTDGGRYPFDVSLRFPATELRAELSLKEVELNPDLDRSLFRVPAGRAE